MDRSAQPASETRPHLDGGRLMAWSLGAAMALLWSGVAYRTWCLTKGPRSPRRVGYVVALLALALAATAFHPTVYGAFDRAVGVPNLAEIVGHSLILAEAWQAHGILIFLVHPKASARRRTWIHLCLIAISVTLMAVFFTLAPVDQEAPQAFTTTFAGAPYVVPYWLTFLITINYLLADIVRLVARYGSRSPDEHLRLGLHLVAIGGTFGLAYWIHWSVYLVLSQAKMAIPYGLRGFGVVCMFGAILFVVLGSTVPALGPRTKLPTPYTWLASRRDYRTLYPLWKALATFAPAIVLQRPPRLVLDVRFWLNRRVIEIEDGLRVCAQTLAAESDAASPVGSGPAAQVELIRRIAAIDRTAINESAPTAPTAGTELAATAGYADRLQWHLDLARAYVQAQRSGTGPVYRRPTPLPSKEANTAR